MIWIYWLDDQRESQTSHINHWPWCCTRKVNGGFVLHLIRTGVKECVPYLLRWSLLGCAWWSWEAKDPGCDMGEILIEYQKKCHSGIIGSCFWKKFWKLHPWINSNWANHNSQKPNLTEAYLTSKLALLWIKVLPDDL